MVPYFITRGGFLLKATKATYFRQLHKKCKQPHAQEKWPIFRSLRFKISTTFSKINSKKDARKPVKLNFENRAHVQQTSVGQRSVHIYKANDDTKQSRNTLTRWTALLLKWSPISFCLFAAVEWQLNKRNCVKRQTLHTASQFQAMVYCSLPFRLMSRCWGWLASCYIPESLRPFVYGLYSNVFSVNLEEALYTDFKHYNNLSEFFTRSLREDVRPIDLTAPLVSPADGRILHFGTAHRSLIEQVKGVYYSIGDFLGPNTWEKTTSMQQEIEADYADTLKHNKGESTMLFQCVIYLAPGDYHRFHSPTHWKPTFRRHFTGELLSVSPRIATWLPGLFCLNERAVYVGKWEHGFFSYTAVGATNVGSLQIFIDEELKTNRWTGLKRNATSHDLKLQSNLVWRKGDLVGQFNMGSTIVLLFEAPINFKFNLETGQKIHVGEPLGHIR